MDSHDFKYIKNYKNHASAYGQSTSITPQKMTPGSRVVIGDAVKEHAGKEGIVVGIAGNDINKLRVKLTDGKVIKVAKDDITF